jgi:hypothetical protein
VFKRVDSKGLSRGEPKNLMSRSDLNAKCISEIKTGPKSRYSWALDYPNEVNRIIDRHKTLGSLKLCPEDFVGYNLIICFTESDFESVMSSRADAAIKYPSFLKYNNVKLLTGPKDVSAGEHLTSLDNTSLRMAMREIVESFINEDFGSWYNRKKVPVEDRYRILQFTMPVKGLPQASKEKGYVLSEIPQVEEWEKEMGCQIKITKLDSKNEPGNKEGLCLVSVIGPKGSNLGVSQSGMNSTLHKVEKMFREYAT